MRAKLSFADNSQWHFLAKEPFSKAVLTFMAAAMGMQSRDGVIRAGSSRNTICLIDSPNGFQETLPVSQDGVLIWKVYRNIEHRYIKAEALGISQFLGIHIQERGAVLLHGALAAKGGRGVILAGPSGGGKTTASKRLPPSWISLADDATLVVRDPQGKYWAHPWPTWSSFEEGRVKRTWNVGNAVSLEGIFFIEKSAADRVHTVLKRNAIGMLWGAAQQVIGRALSMASNQEAKSIRHRCFNTVANLVDSVPQFELHLSLTGNFWLAIEEALLSCLESTLELS